MAGAAVARRLELGLPAPALYSILGGAGVVVPSSAAGPGMLQTVSWPFSANHLPWALVALAAALALWIVRERRIAAHRRVIRSLYSLSEEMVSASLPSDHLRRLQSALPRLLRITGVRLYLPDRTAGVLHAVAPEDPGGPGSESQDADKAFRSKAVESCYRNRSMLSIPDTRRSPFVSESSPVCPRSALFVPMFARGELRGVLEIHHATRVRQFSQEEQAIAQHLANQIAIGLKLAEQRDTQLRLFRSEKLAATGQIVSNVARELQAPLLSVANLAETVLLGDTGSPAQRELRAISAKARNALDTVRRLLTLARSGEEDTQPVSASVLLRRLLDLRKRRWGQSGIGLADCLTAEPEAVECSPSHLEHILSSLLAHAEQALVLAPGKRELTVRSSRLGNTVHLEITGSGGTLRLEGPGPAAADEGILGLPLCRSILRSHEGDLRISEADGGGWTIEVELRAAASPALAGGASASGASGRPLTTLVVEPDAADRQALITLLDAKGHRAVPVTGAEEGTAMLGRMHFHVVLCSVRLPGMNWLQFMESCRTRADAFVLLTDGYDAELQQAVAEQDAFILAKPLQAAEVVSLLETIDARLPAGR